MEGKPCLGSVGKPRDGAWVWKLRITPPQKKMSFSEKTGEPHWFHVLLGKREGNMCANTRPWPLFRHREPTLMFEQMCFKQVWTRRPCSHRFAAGLDHWIHLCPKMSSNTKKWIPSFTVAGDQEQETNIKAPKSEKTKNTATNWKGERRVYQNGCVLHKEWARTEQPEKQRVQCIGFCLVRSNSPFDFFANDHALTIQPANSMLTFHWWDFQVPFVGFNYDSPVVQLSQLSVRTAQLKGSGQIWQSWECAGLLKTCYGQNTCWPFTRVLDNMFKDSEWRNHDHDWCSIFDMFWPWHGWFLPFASEYLLFSPVGFKGNPSLFDIFSFFPLDLSKWKVAMLISWKLNHKEVALEARMCLFRIVLFQRFEPMEIWWRASNLAPA